MGFFPLSFLQVQPHPRLLQILQILQIQSLHIAQTDDHHGHEDLYTAALGICSNNHASIEFDFIINKPMQPTNLGPRRALIGKKDI